MRFDSSLEHEHTQRPVAVRLDFISGSIDGCGHILHERHDIAEEFHHTAHTHILECADTEHRINGAVNESLTDSFTHLIFCQVALFEEFLHQCLIVLGRSLYQRLVHLLGFFHLFGRDILDGGNTAVRAPGVFLHKKDIYHSVEARAALERILDRHNARTEDFLHLLDAVVIIGLFPVKLVEGENHRFLELGGRAENVLRTNLHSILGVNDDNAGVGHVQGCDGIAHEVICSGAVDDVEFLVEELSVEDRGENRVTILFFYREIVRYSVLGINCATAFYYSTLVKHSFSECGFPGSLAAEQGDVFDFVGLIDLHGNQVLC